MAADGIRGVEIDGAEPKELVLSDGSRLCLETEPLDRGRVEWRRSGYGAAGDPVSLPDALDLAGDELLGVRRGSHPRRGRVDADRRRVVPRAGRSSCRASCAPRPSERGRRGLSGRAGRARAGRQAAGVEEAVHAADHRALAVAVGKPLQLGRQRAIRGCVIDSGRQNLRIPYSPWRKPMPDSFQPPIGTSVAAVVGQHVVDVDRAALDAPGDPLGALVVAEKTEADSP